MNIYKAVGLEWILKEDVWGRLDKHIPENVRYVIPGYKYNYRLCSFPGYIELQRCELLDGTTVETNIHFCADHHWKVEVSNVISEDGATHKYALKSKNGEVFTARVVCPDVLPSVKPGDIFDGQIVAFADKITKMPEGSAADGGVFPCEDDCVNFTGVITDVNLGSFEFDGKTSQFWELDVDTENGGISVIIAEHSLDFEPDVDDNISVHAMISMDAAVEHKKNDDAAFYVDPYEGILCDTEVTYRNGFLPDYHRDQRAFINSIETGDLSRFLRCCEREVSFVSNKESDNGIWNLDKKKLVDALKTALPEHIDKVEVLHFLSCKVEAFIGHDAIAVYSNDELKLAIWFDVCEKGTIEEVQFFNPEECVLGLDYELHLQAMFAHAVCDDRIHILHEYLSNGCMYRSEYADVCLVGSRNIVNRFLDIRDNIDEENRYTYEFARAKDELSQTYDLPRIYKRNWCTVNYQGGKLAYVLFLDFDCNHKITNVLLMQN